MKEELQRVMREVEQGEEAVAAKDRWASSAVGDRSVLGCRGDTWSGAAPHYCFPIPSPPIPSPHRKLDSLAHTHRVELSELKIRWVCPHQSCVQTAEGLSTAAMSPGVLTTPWRA